MKVREGEWPFYGEQLQDLYRLTVTGDYATGSGSYEERDIYEHYYEIAAGQVDLDRTVKIVLDPGNGAGTLTAPTLLKQIGADVTTIFEEPDGTFPNRPPDPLSTAAIQPLAQKVVETGAELGIAIDADGDRIAVVDHTGEMVWPDKYVMPIFRALLEKRYKDFVTEVRCSQSLADYVRERDGILHMAACGYPFILEEMRKTGAAMGFETTGHCYFHNPYIKFDDASFAAARMVEALSWSDESLRDIVAEAPVYYTSEEFRTKCPDEHKFVVAEKVAQMYAADHEIIDVDGARIQFDNGWALIRASNTGEELVMRWEADTPEGRDEIGGELVRRVEAVTKDVVG
jgi:phosphomannomutase/phosphoglucomutase